MEAELWGVSIKVGTGLPFLQSELQKVLQSIQLHVNLTSHLHAILLAVKVELQHENIAFSTFSLKESL